MMIDANAALPLLYWKKNLKNVSGFGWDSNP